MAFENPLFQSIELLINNVLKDLFTDQYQDNNTNINIQKMLLSPPQKEMGDLSFACFILSKKYKKNPNDLAEIIAGQLNKDLTPNSPIANATFLGPYINFTLNIKFLQKYILMPILNMDFFSSDNFKNKTDQNEKIMIEYSQPNTHKNLHVGHMRNLCLGNALILLNRYVQKNIMSATYPGDMGTHVAKCLYYLKNFLMQDISKIENDQRGKWLGGVYTRSEKHFQSLEEKQQKELKQELGIILKAINKADPDNEYYKLWKETRSWSIALMKSIYSWAHVDFDHWFFESKEDKESVEYINQLYKQNKIIKNDGALGMDLSQEKLKFCLLLKSDGTGLYATKDIMLAKNKFEKYNITSNIYIVDERQKFHFKQVFKVLEKLNFKNAKNCHHIPYAMVELSTGAMSSRKGNIILISDLINNMQEKIKTNYLNKHIETWSAQEIDKTAQRIANAAIKYGMLRVDNNRKIIFDMDQWLKLDGETGPYLQYVVARINSIKNKITLNREEIDFSLLTTSSEKNIMNHLITINNVIQSCADKYQTIHLCSYLYSLSQYFNNFYANCSISKAESSKLKNSRLALAICVSNTLKVGLSCLGIECPERM